MVHFLISLGHCKPGREIMGSRKHKFIPYGVKWFVHPSWIPSLGGITIRRWVMKKLFVLFSVLLSVSAGSLSAEPHASPIIIGNLSGFTGTYSAMAKMQKDAVDMAVQEINAQGGLLGRRVEVIHEDTETKPSVGQRKMEQLILEKGAHFFVGAISSAVTLNLMEIAAKYNKILMVPISQSPKITTTNKNKQTFRVCANPTITSGALARYIVSNLGKNIYLLTVDYAWGRDTSAVYHEVLKQLGANIVGETFFPLGTKDFAPYFGKIKAARPEVLFITAAGNDAISVVTQLEEYGLKKLMHVCGDGSLVAEDVLGAMGNAAEGIITADYYSAGLDTPENREWASRYEKLFGSPPSKFSVSSYEAVMWLAQAVRQAGTVETEKVISALEGSTYSGPQGRKIMDPESHQTSLSVYMIRIEGGQRKIFGEAK
jgi:branched-chain amino acid transport system substrate-binding protein